MLIHNPKALTRGLLLMSTFIAVFIVFFLEVFPSHKPGEKVTGLVFADHLFNTLSKGSSNFFDKTATDKNSVEFRIRNTAGKKLDIQVPFQENQEALKTLAAKLAKASGLEVTASEKGLHLKGDLHAFLLTIVNDSHSTFNNNVEEVAARYGLPADQGRLIMKSWWTLGSNLIKPLQRVGQVEEANAVNATITRAIEPSYNFYGIEPLQVRDNVPLVAGFLIFYVVYTMWYGFAIFELFEGIGLTMKKSVKQEV